MLIDCKLKDIHMRIQVHMLVEEDFKDEEEEELVENMARLSVITMDREDTSRETVRYLQQTVAIVSLLIM